MLFWQIVCRGCSQVLSAGVYHIYIAHWFGKVGAANTSVIAHGTAPDVAGPFAFDARPVMKGTAPQVVAWEPVPGGATQYVLFTSGPPAISISFKPGGPFAKLDVTGSFHGHRCGNSAPALHHGVWHV